LKSSGSDILDEAALKLVESSVYEPGTIDGVISAFWLHLPVQFKLGEMNELSVDIDNWIELALLYQKQIETDPELDKSKMFKNLYDHYQTLAMDIGNSRSISANMNILAIIEKSVSEPWISYQDKWPLGFLLYEDFIKRYPDNQFATKSRSELIKAYQIELEFLEKKSISKMPYADIYSLISESLKILYDQDLN